MKVGALPKTVHLGSGPEAVPLQVVGVIEQLGSQVMASIASFDTGWIGMSLAIFGLHLLGLGYLLFKSINFPRFLGVLVVIAGAGYLADSFVRILAPATDRETQ